jgi:hypothetical protein
VRVEELELDARQAAGDRPERFLLAGGVAPDETEQIVAEVRAAARAHGRVVLELRLGEQAPQIVLRPQNVSVLQPQLRSLAASQRGSA